jgi:5-methylcytosine-specific restriction endonuclease McrA
MSERVATSLRGMVQARAGFRCEYCLIHEEDSHFAHQPDHVIARKHRGPTVDENLAWACYLCNLLKGSDIASVDLETGQIVRLFNPRVDNWADHFRLADGQIVALTPIGRVTEHLLQFNQPLSVHERQLLIAAGRYPR